MRVGIDSWGMADGTVYSGFGQYTSLLLRHLAAAGVEVIGYGAPSEPRPGWLPSSAGWRAPRQVRLGRLSAIASRLRQLDRMAVEDRIDVFHAPAVHVRPSYPPVPQLMCPVVTTVHDVIPLTYYAKSLPIRLKVFYRWNLDRALASARVITVSQRSRDDVLAIGRPSRPRVTVIPNAIEFAPNYDPSQLWNAGVKPPYMLFAGSYEPRKNLAGAISAFALLAAQGFPHDLVAIVERSSGHAAGLLRQVAASGLESRIRLLHSLEDATIRALYAYADLLMFPSLAEGFGFPPLQAAACDVPVVASRLSVIEETMGDGAVLVDGTVPEQIAQAAALLLADAERRHALTQRARARLSGFGLSSFIDRHVQVYEEVSAKKSAQN